jgi:RNA polymerase sigma factor (sigma-70 family)
MNPSQGREGEELSLILESYAQFMHRHIQKFNLLKYGLDPEDIMQDVRIKIWNLIRSERTVYSRGAYIKKIINSSVIDQLRRIRRQDCLFLHEKQNQIAELGRPYNHDKEAARQKALRDLICKGVERLIRSRRQVIKLYLFGFSIQEISSYLGWSIDKTRNLLYRGLADLRKYLKRTDYQHEVRR